MISSSHTSKNKLVVIDVNGTKKKLMESALRIQLGEVN